MCAGRGHWRAVNSILFFAVFYRFVYARCLGSISTNDKPGKAGLSRTATLEVSVPAKPLRNFSRRFAAGVTRRLATGFLTEFYCDRRGSVTIYAALASAVLMGAGILAFDSGRATMIQMHMQSVADSAAQAAAARLDGQRGARERARFAAVSVSEVNDAVDTISDEPPIVVDDILFFRELFPAPVPATLDEEARFVQVTMKPRQVKTILAPMIQVFAEGDYRTPGRIGASSVVAADGMRQETTLAYWTR